MRIKNPLASIYMAMRNASAIMKKGPKMGKTAWTGLEKSVFLGRMMDLKSVTESGKSQGVSPGLLKEEFF